MFCIKGAFQEKMEFHSLKRNIPHSTFWVCNCTQFRWNATNSSFPSPSPPYLTISPLLHRKQIQFLLYVSKSFSKGNLYLNTDKTCILTSPWQFLSEMGVNPAARTTSHFKTLPEASAELWPEEPPSCDAQELCRRRPQKTTLRLCSGRSLGQQVVNFPT